MIGQRCFKIIFNFINCVTITGTLMSIVMSIVALSDQESLFKMLNIAVDSHNFKIAISNWIRKYAVGILSFATLLFIISLTGCVGSIMDNGAALLVIYIIFVMLLIMLTLAFIILITIKNEEASIKFYKYLQKILIQNYDGTHLADGSLDSLIIDFIQIKFDCCAIHELEDYEKALHWTIRKYSGYEALYYPASCCRMDKTKKQQYVKPFEMIDEDKCLEYSQFLADNSRGSSFDKSEVASFSNANRPCKQEIQNFIYTNSHYIWSFFLFIISFQYTSLIFAILIKNTKKDH